MNLYYIAEHLTDSNLKNLTSMASYKKLAMGDILVLRIDRRIVLAFVNQPPQMSLRPIDFPMISQVICDNFDDLKPIIYFNNNYDICIGEVDVLKQLLSIFKKSEIASEVISETIDLLTFKECKRNSEIVARLLASSKSIPLSNGNISDENHTETCSEGEQKLLIVEKFFSEQMKTEFYDYITLGKTNREALVLMRRKYVSVFKEIFKKIDVAEIYKTI